MVTHLTLLFRLYSGAVLLPHQACVTHNVGWEEVSAGYRGENTCGGFNNRPSTLHTYQSLSSKVNDSSVEESEVTGTHPSSCSSPPQSSQNELWNLVPYNYIHSCIFHSLYYQQCSRLTCGINFFEALSQLKNTCWLLESSWMLLKKRRELKKRSNDMFACFFTGFSQWLTFLIKAPDEPHPWSAESCDLCSVLDPTGPPVASSRASVAVCKRECVLQPARSNKS